MTSAPSTSFDFLVRNRIVHQRRIDQIVPLGVGAGDRLDRGDDRQRQERADRAEQRAEGQDGKEGDRIVDVHGAAGDLRREDQVFDLLVDADERHHGDRLPQTTAAPGEQHRQRAADVRAEHRDELRYDAAEQRQRHPIRHVQRHQADRGEERVEHGEDGT